MYQRVPLLPNPLYHEANMSQKQSFRKPQTMGLRTPIPPPSGELHLWTGELSTLLGLSPGSVDASTTQNLNKVIGRRRGSEDAVIKRWRLICLQNYENVEKNVANDRTRNGCSSKRQKWGHIEVKVILKLIFERLKALLQMGIRHIIHLNFFSFPAFLATESSILMWSFSM